MGCKPLLLAVSGLGKLLEIRECQHSNPCLSAILSIAYRRRHSIGTPLQAASEFRKFSDHRGVVGSYSWGALARLGLARAYTLQGDTGKAKAAYQGFFTLWKDADPDIPVLTKATGEYSQLK